MVPGEPRQREFAFRAGVNIVMYTLTGNYKADQVHIPALLEDWDSEGATTLAFVIIRESGRPSIHRTCCVYWVPRFRGG